MNIYLDNQTTTRPSKTVLDAMLPFFCEKWGTLSAPHKFGKELFLPLEEAYKALYKLMGAEEDDLFIFTSSGSEAVNQAIFSTYLSVTRTTGKNHFVTTAIDEAPTILSLERLQEFGCITSHAPVNSNGFTTKELIADSITPRTALVSLSLANGLTGVLQPIEEIAELCKERGIVLHVDVTHMVGKGYFPWHEWGVDILTFNGEQFHAPKGTGGLFVRADFDLHSLIVGGNEQLSLRGGSLNVPALIGLGEAAKESFANINHICTETSRLRTLFETLLQTTLKEVTPFFQNVERAPNITALNFPKVTSDALLYLLSRQGIYATLGGCAFQHIKHVLKASSIETHSALSFALSRETTEAEIHLAALEIEKIYVKLRKCAEHIEVTL